VAVPGDHRILCSNTGKLASGGKVEAAFQFYLTNIGKTYTAGTANDETKGTVQTIAKTLTCKLTISTFGTSTASNVPWYESSLILNIDGNTESNKNGLFQSFIAYKDTFKSFG